MLGNGVSNVTIENSNIGPCGSSSGSDASGVHFEGGSGNAVYDSYIHVQTNGSGNNMTYAGVFFDGSTNGTAQGNVIAYTGVGVESNTSGTRAIGNFILNNVNTTLSGNDGLSVGMGFDGATSPVTNQNFVLECVASGNGVPCSSYISATPFEYENVVDLPGVFQTNGGSFSNDYLVAATIAAPSGTRSQPTRTPTTTPSTENSLSAHQAASRLMMARVIRLRTASASRLRISAGLTCPSPFSTTTAAPIHAGRTP